MTYLTNKLIGYDENPKAFDIFEQCVKAINGEHMSLSRGTKGASFNRGQPFEEWFGLRVTELGMGYKRNKTRYPDFELSDHDEWYEAKGVTYNRSTRKHFDLNSQYPVGYDNGRDVYYAFAVYDHNDEGIPEIQSFLMLHGSFINTDDSYVHKNDNFKNHGSFNDVMLRVSKKYMCTNPFDLLHGNVRENPTLILPYDIDAPAGFKQVGVVVRRVGNENVNGFVQDFKRTKLNYTTEPDPNAGKEYHYYAYRTADGADDPVSFNEEYNKYSDLLEWETPDETPETETKLHVVTS